MHEHIFRNSIENGMFYVKASKICTHKENKPLFYIEIFTRMLNAALFVSRELSLLKAL